MKKKKKLKPTKLFIIILFSLATLSLVYSIYNIVSWQIDNKKISNATDKINEVVKTTEKDTGENINPPKDKFDPYWDYIKLNLLEVDFNDLIKINPDTVGWIYIGGTNINYPVVQCSNNDFYLNHDFNENWNDAGWIFMDYRNDAVNFNKNTIIYGHSRYDKSMFGSLRNIIKNNWVKNTENHIIKFSTPTENTLWQVFSVYTIEAENYYITTSFDNDDNYKSWINTMIDRSVFNFKTTVDNNDKVITISSCYTSDGIRVVLHAKLIKEEQR